MRYGKNTNTSYVHEEFFLIFYSIHLKLPNNMNLLGGFVELGVNNVNVRFPTSIACTQLKPRQQLLKISSSLVAFSIPITL